ncbi:hypothetical protein [Paraburkholderia sp. GAS32]|uniref:hypothetical protein n=1 Tax=Paraburkholderia sp. GAS32 TaxID=3035129 RepID=UPI003D1C9D4A
MSGLSGRVIFTPPAKQGDGNTRFETWSGDVDHNRYVRILTRRVVREGTDEAQIELMIAQTPTRSKGTRTRTQTTFGSVVLSPEEARALALSLCPELEPPTEDTKKIE